MAFYPYNLGMLFAERARASAGRAALCYATDEISYDRLVTLVGQLAAILLRRGYSRGDVIAIAHNKAALSYALMLAALRLGIAYVNIDTASPATRNGHILRTSGARTLFVDDPDHLPAMEDLAATAGIGAQMLSEAKLEPLAEAELLQQTSATAEVDGATIAYIMFTSGSTGMPKGVAVTHQNVLHFIQWGIERFGIDHSDNFANLSPMYFDNSVFDFYVALFSGASLTPVHRERLSAGCPGRPCGGHGLHDLVLRPVAADLRQHNEGPDGILAPGDPLHHLWRRRLPEGRAYQALSDVRQPGQAGQRLWPDRMHLHLQRA
jgi:D-alanine--poly(phosphoribitol) ligase subunit 1